MRKLVFGWLLGIALWPGVAPATLIDVRVSGPSLKGNLLGVPAERDVSIYLPPSYDGHADRRYPTLYLLHGIYDSNTTWTRPWNDEHPGYDTIQALMDAGIAACTLKEMIVVIPDCDEVSHYTDSTVRGGWESFVTRDLVSFVDGSYRTLERATARGIAGHSMGGHGAIKLGMKHPDVFGVVYGLNPSLLGFGGDVSADNPALEELAGVTTPGDLEGVSRFVQAIIAVGQSFSPNPSSPLLTDVPFQVVDGRVTILQPGYDRWRARMPIYLIADHLDGLRKLRALRFDSAFEEQYSHIPLTSRAFSDSLTAYGIEHTFEMYNGDHRNRLWGRQGRLYTELLPYFSRQLE